MKNLSKITKYGDFDIDITEIASVCNEHIIKPWTHHLKNNLSHRILFVYEGEFHAVIDGVEYTVQKNNMLYVPIEATYSSYCGTLPFGYSSIFFHMNPLTGSQFPFQTCCVPEVPEKYRKFFKTVDEEWISKNFGYKLRIKSLLYEIFRNLLIEQLELNIALKGYHVIKDAVNYIEQNYYKEIIDVNKLARMSNITPTHFIRLFKEIYSTTPKQYINNLRIERAIELLEFSTASIDEISNQLGYSDASYFSKAFKNAMGKSPLQFRTHI